MSLILDALKRAEQERSEKNPIPSLQSMHGSTAVARPSLLQRLHLERWLIALVVAYLAYDYLSEGPARPVATPAPAPVAAPVNTPAPAPEAAYKPQAEELVVPEPEPESELAPAPVLAAKPEPVPVAESVPAAPVASSREVQSLYKTPVNDAAISAAASTAEALADTTVAAASQAGSTQRQRAFDRTEDITQLPLGFRQQIPSLKYGDHIPAAETGNSRVVLNGSVHKEGDQVAPGLVLKGISEKGIVLEFQGTLFRLDAYNSWINFQ